MTSTSETEIERHSGDTRERVSEGEETFRSFFKSSPFMMGIVEFLEDDILHVADNPSSVRFFGIRSEGMANRMASELGVPSESIRLWSEHYREAEKSGSPSWFEYPMRRGDQTPWLSVTVNYIAKSKTGRSRFSYIVQDVTDTKLAQQEVARARGELESKIEAATASSFP